MSKKPTVKILVGYHKPAYLLKNDVFVPIHLGRALVKEDSKDGKISEEDYQWMLNNMIGDDTGENISNLNRKFCELTALYWAWKNYDKIDNPDYIGFCHYRRFLDFSENIDYNHIKNGIVYKDRIDTNDILPYNKKFVDNISEYDIVHGDLINHNLSVKEQFVELETPQFGLRAYIFNEVLDYLKDIYPTYSDAIKEYTSSKKHYWYNCFIMKKEYFEEYCEMLFSVLLHFDKKIDYDLLTINGQRILAYISERLLGIFITKNKDANILYRPIAFFSNTDIERDVIPAYTTNSVPIVISGDNNYAPYLGVCIKSIIENSTSQNNYEIYILEADIDMYYKTEILKMQSANVYIKFINISNTLNSIDINSLYTCNHFTIATYFRFFIPRIFRKFKKILYLDCDTIVLDDVSILYNIDLHNKYIAAVQDIEMFRAVYNDKFYHSNWGEYLEKTLQLTSKSGYFQAGVMIFDIKKLLDYNFEQKCLDLLSRIKPIYVDQCIMNSVLQNKVLYTNIEWNVQWQIPLHVNIEHQLPYHLCKKYKESLNKPKIIHYAGNIKPWNNTNYSLSAYWWMYARKTSFYEELLIKLFSINKQNNVNIKKIDTLKYWRYKILSEITFGNMRKKYKEKKKKMKEIIISMQ